MLGQRNIGHLDGRRRWQGACSCRLGLLPASAEDVSQALGTAMSCLHRVRCDGAQAASSNSSWRSRRGGEMGGALGGRPTAVRKAWMAAGSVRAAITFM